ncbi:hypothetical protein ACWENA_08305 [Streptomyces sp. NPDC004779]
MPKIRSARGEVFNTDRMSPAQIIIAAARLEDYENDLRAAEALIGGHPAAG